MVHIAVIEMPMRLRGKEQQLQDLYCPIWNAINADIYANSYDEGYYGLDENTVSKIIQIIHDNNSIADSELLNWGDYFEKEVYDSMYYIRPTNPDYDPLYDKDNKFFIFIETQINILRKDTYID